MNWKSKKYWLVVFLLLLTGGYVNVLRYVEVNPGREPRLSNMPLNHGQWVGRELHLGNRTAEVLRADQVLFREYMDPLGDRVWLFVAYFRSQTYGAQIHSPKHCLPGGGWKILRREKYRFQFMQSNETAVLPVNKMLISDGRSTELMFYWFITRSGTITNEFMLKLDLALNSLRRKPTDAAFVRITVPLNGRSQRETLKVGQRFVEDVVGNLNQYLPF